MEVWKQRVTCKVSEARRDPLRSYFRRHINFARDPLLSYFHEPQKNETHLLYLQFVFTSFLFIICGIVFYVLQISGEEKL